MAKSFKSTAGVWVNFKLHYQDRTCYNTEYQGMSREIVKKDNGEIMANILPDNSTEDQIRIGAVKEFIAHEHQEFLSWLEQHPEMKAYAN